jgi:heat shock protein 4
MARQAERPKNVNPAMTSEEILKRRDEVSFFCSAILNKPKPRAPAPPKTDAPPPKEEAPAPEAAADDMDVADELD